VTAAAAAGELAPVEAPPAAGAGPQFARGFDGMATAPFPEESRRVLAEAVNPHDVEIKPDGIVFLPGVAYRRILTRAFGAGGWAIAPRSPARYMKDNNIVVYHGALFCLGRFVAEAVGECFYRDNNPNMSYASCVEGAKTDALSRCCKDLGIATEMWDANWREQWKAQYATSYRGKKWNAKKQQEEEATIWKLKSRVSNPHDLMVGAGGVEPAGAAPPAVPPSRASSGASTIPPASPSPPSADAAGVAASPSPSAPSAPDEPGTVSPAPDTGEAATNDQKDALRTHIRQKKWTLKYCRLWFAGLFGTIFNDGDPLEKLSQQQADAAFTLLLAHGTGAYEKLVAEERARGIVTVVG
jgi:hypothetical protein